MKTGKIAKIERAESVHARAEELEMELDELKRRCRSAEKEVDAQKELIDVSVLGGNAQESKERSYSSGLWA